MNIDNRGMDNINGQDAPIPKRHCPSDRFVEENDGLLTLSLSDFATRLSRPTSPQPPSIFINPSLFPFHCAVPPASVLPSPSAAVQPRRARRKPSKSPSEGKSATIPPPYPWSTDRRATVHSFDYLLSQRITSVSGDVECKRCERRYKIEFDLRQKFMEIGSFIASMKNTMRQRAPRAWMNPTLPRCSFCNQENSARPSISNKKRSINWLFLLLGQMLGCCTLDQLKYFCKHTKNHRTGAKDRVLYLTYLALCKQLDPTGPFDMSSD